MATRVILVRHGRSSYNAQGKIQGRCDESVLTEEGRQSALRVAEALKEIDFAALYSSPLQRAKQTADAIHEALQQPSLPLQVSENLLEIDLPLWENQLRQTVVERYGEAYRTWKQRPHEFYMEVPDNGSTTRHFPVIALRAQAELFWEELLSRHEGETVMVVAHNGINRCLLSTALEIPAQYYHNVQQSNCGISVLNFSGLWGDSVQLESMNLLSHEGNPFPKPRTPHRGPRLLLVRHGETEWNRESRFQGQIDVPLNDTGREQSRGAAKLLESVPLDFAVTSPMLRPKETAEIILERHPNVELQLDNGLREIGHGLWEGKLESEIREDYADLLDRWQSAPETVQMPEGENLQQVWDRAVAAWHQIVEAADTGEPQTGIVVGHDAINKAILCHLFGFEPKDFWRFKQGNGAVSVIDYPEGAQGLPVLQAMNITGGVLDRTAAGAL